MYQVKLFSGSIVENVQEEINAWLSSHKDIAVSHSCMDTAAAPGKEKMLYTFYLLFTTSEARIEELKELAAEIKPESSVEVNDINPDVLQATN